MYPYPLQINADNTIGRQPQGGKPTEKVTIDDISEKELLLRQVALSQSIRSMLLFFVWIAIIEIIAGIAILSRILK